MTKKLIQETLFPEEDEAQIQAENDDGALEDEIQGEEESSEPWAFVLPPFSQPLEINGKAIYDAYEGLKITIYRSSQVRQAFVVAETDLARMKVSLEYNKQAAIIDGKNVGKNDAQREAFSHQLFYEEYENIDRQSEEVAELRGSMAYADMVVKLWDLECKKIDKLLDLLTLDAAAHPMMAVQE